MKLSVVIVNYNVRYFLEQCLRSCLKAAEQVETEIIVVDNASSDQSDEMMRRVFPDVQYHYLNENLGFSKGNNYGIKRASGEFVLLLNPDTIVAEDTFAKCVSFMENHADAGGLGVYMIDGNGQYLPESKRGLPTPEAAFYKMTGLSALWPDSERFGSYHLGFLDKNQTHEVEILSGAFMMIRKKVLDEIGMLDEDFFMYGEDIDLSYRITKAGYKNYYFPETKIIHYKGESTKKGSANYVFVFYRAMVIFAQKHFKRGQASVLTLFINSAIYFRASLALVRRVVGRYWQMIADGILSYFCFVGISNWYATEFDKQYDLPFITWALGIYSISLLISVLYSGGYDKPYRLGRFSFGWGVGFLLLLVLYSLLPENYRFSRAVLIFGTLSGFLVNALWRVLLHFSPFDYKLTERSPQRRLIVTSEKKLSPIIESIKSFGFHSEFNAGVSFNSDRKRLPENFVSTLAEMKQAVNDFNCEEVILDAEELSFSEAIAQIEELGDGRIELKMSHDSGSTIIGPQMVYSKQAGLIAKLIDPRHQQRVRREKRSLDLVLSLLLLLLSPVFIFIVDEKAGFIRNCLSVLFGAKTWVGYDPRGKAQNLPALKRGVIHKNLQVIWPNKAYDLALAENWNFFEEYRISSDLKIVFKHLHSLGN